jgi:hypothetical protein
MDTRMNYFPFVYSLILKHPALRMRALQLLSVCFLFGSACTTVPPDLSILPEGYYKFDCPIFYKDGMVRITHTPKGAHVQMLETFAGSFVLEPKGQNELTMTRDSVSYPELKRTLSGSGILTRTGHAEGQAKVWIKDMGPLSRNHRKGTWTLRLASAKEIKSFEQKQKVMEERKERAREAGLDVE